MMLLGYCTRPITGPNVAIMENSISGLQGSMITYYCRWTPNEHMVATCLSNGSWSPDPRDMVCPSHTTIHNYNITTGYSVELGNYNNNNTILKDINSCIEIVARNCRFHACTQVFWMDIILMCLCRKWIRIRSTESSPGYFSIICDLFIPHSAVWSSSRCFDF